MVPASVLRAPSSWVSCTSPRTSPTCEGACAQSLLPTCMRWSEHFSAEIPLSGRSSFSSSSSARRTLPLMAMAHSNQGKEEEECRFMRVIQKCAVCLMASVTLASMQPLSLPAQALVTNHIFDDLAILIISGPPVKDPSTLLRNALPIDSKPFKEVEKSLEDISDSLKLAGSKAFDPVERNVRQAARALSQNKLAIIANLAPAKKETGEALLDKLTVGLQELQKIVEDKNRDEIAPKQKELLYIVGD